MFVAEIKNTNNLGAYSPPPNHYNEISQFNSKDRIQKSFGR